MLDAAATLVTAAGLLVGLLVWLRTRRWSAALGALLDFLIAAGLLRLAARPGVADLLVIPGIIVVRRAASGALLRDVRALRAAAGRRAPRGSGAAQS